jgi:spore coat polysaccharide biosynthesis protein SpsF (cytidylyltransferase family)
MTKPMLGQPMILWMLERASRINADTLVVAMPNTLECERVLLPLVQRHGHQGFLYNGDENDVLSRYATTAAILPDIDLDDTIIRLTGDCTLIDRDLTDEILEDYKNGNWHYVALAKEWPDGLDIEMFPMWLLIEVNDKAEKSYEREHVTPWIWNNDKFNTFEYPCPFDLSDHKWSVDTDEDFKVIEQVLRYTLMQYGPDFDWFDVYCTLIKRVELLNHVTSTPRNTAFIEQMFLEEGIEPHGNWNEIRYGKKERVNVSDVLQQGDSAC